MNTPNLALPQMAANTMQPSVDYNEAVKLLDALAQPVAVSRTIAAPPTTVAGDAGKCWIVAAGASGQWAGKENQIALCVGANLWQFIIPKAGWKFYVLATSTDVRYSGTAWA